MNSPVCLIVAVVLSLATVTSPLAAQSQQAESPLAGHARTPPMGWNSWNKFGCDVSEALIKEIADAMVASGMKDAG
jgi:alpha-galactosidase